MVFWSDPGLMIWDGATFASVASVGACVSESPRVSGNPYQEIGSAPAQRLPMIISVAVEPSCSTSRTHLLINSKPLALDTVLKRTLSEKPRDARGMMRARGIGARARSGSAALYGPQSGAGRQRD